MLFPNENFREKYNQRARIKGLFNGNTTHVQEIIINAASRAVKPYHPNFYVVVGSYIKVKY